MIKVQYSTKLYIFIMDYYDSIFECLLGDYMYLNCNIEKFEEIANMYNYVRKRENDPNFKRKRFV